MRTIDVDYLVVGAGAMGMAFADTIVAETSATVAIVDRYARPSGHWTVAYPFVRLHQPSSGYGVPSRPLGDDALDQVGWNAGLLELATGDEVCGYFERVMQETLLPTGRVTYLPMTEHLSEGLCQSRVTGEQIQVRARTVVDATYLKISVPSMRRPAYDVAPEVQCVAPNGLASLATPPERIVVVGGGKTAMDTCLWLLSNNVSPDRISWIVPRDSWLVPREATQPDPRLADSVTAVLVAGLTAIVEATSVEDLFDRFEACGRMLRLDPEVRPTMFRCATVSRPELDQLRRIRDVVRLGRVQRIGTDEILLEHGTLPTTLGTLHVDCTADGLARRPVVPVFAPGRITLQTVRSCQQAFSAALIAHVEASQQDPVQKNALCEPVPNPDHELDVFRTVVDDLRNLARWEDAGLTSWLESCRLDWLRRLGHPWPEDEAARFELAAQVRAANDAVSAKLEALLEQALVRA